MSLDPYQPPDVQPPRPNQGDRLGDNAGVRMLLPVGRSAWAIIAGYLGLLSFVLVPAPLALIVSLVAISRIRKSRTTGRPLFGMGRAIFGLIMGFAGTVILMILLINKVH